MPRRIEIELTSHADAVWTWRAAGAKQPKGSLADSLVPDGASVGDVLRADVESGLDGLEVTGVFLKAEKSGGKPPNRIEMLGAPKREPGVSVAYASGSRRRRDAGERGGRRDAGERGGRRDAGERGERGERGGRRGAGERGGGGPGRSGVVSDREGSARRRGVGAERQRPGGAGLHRERRPAVSTVHRNALLAGLGPEQLPVAEQLLRGGIPAVRRAIAEQQGTHRGVPVNADPLLAIAEELLPAVNLASWKDRATAAQAEGAELHLRELRAVVAASRTVTLDEEGRTLARALLDAQERRVTALRNEWLTAITKSLESDHVPEALRTASHPPEPATRLPADLAVRLAEAAGAAMTAALASREWLALLDAVLESPVRRTVKPAGIPDTPVAQESARHAAGLVPELAKLLGLRIPPPPPRRTVVRRPPPLTPSRGGGPAVSP